MSKLSIVYIQTGVTALFMADKYQDFDGYEPSAKKTKIKFLWLFGRTKKTRVCLRCQAATNNNNSALSTCLWKNYIIREVS